MTEMGMLVVPEDRAIRAEIRADTAERDVRRLRKLALIWLGDGTTSVYFKGATPDERLDYLISITPDPEHDARRRDGVVA